MLTPMLYLSQDKERGMIFMLNKITDYFNTLFEFEGEDIMKPGELLSLVGMASVLVGFITLILYLI